MKGKLVLLWLGPETWSFLNFKTLLSSHNYNEAFI